MTGLAILCLLGLFAGLCMGVAGVLALITPDQATNGVVFCVFFCLATVMLYSANIPNVSKE